MAEFDVDGEFVELASATIGSLDGLIAELERDSQELADRLESARARRQAYVLWLGAKGFHFASKFDWRPKYEDGPGNVITAAPGQSEAQIPE